jgi:four helix bundle protein
MARALRALYSLWQRADSSLVSLALWQMARSLCSLYSRRNFMAFRFERLEIFQLALDFASSTYEKTKQFPLEEKFDLTSQTRRAANSIALNIAEGSGRGTNRDFSHFLDIAVGSTFEVVTCFFLAKKHKYISECDLEGIKREGELLSKKIHSFKNTLGK